MKVRASVTLETGKVPWQLGPRERNGSVLGDIRGNGGECKVEP